MTTAMRKSWLCSIGKIHFSEIIPKDFGEIDKWFQIDCQTYSISYMTQCKR